MDEIEKKFLINILNNIHDIVPYLKYHESELKYLYELMKINLGEDFTNRKTSCLIDKLLLTMLKLKTKPVKVPYNKVRKAIKQKSNTKLCEAIKDYKLLETDLYGEMRYELKKMLDESYSNLFCGSMAYMWDFLFQDLQDIKSVLGEVLNYILELPEIKLLYEEQNKKLI